VEAGMSIAETIVENFVAMWLRETEIGRHIAASHGFDPAIDHIFELLNAGFLKMQMKGEAIVDLVPCNPPIRPTATIRRPPRRAN
jgi:hypothetical protein